jgi:hypothetical protein
MLSGSLEIKGRAVCSATTDPDGTFSCTGNIPDASSAGADGSHNISAEGSISFALGTTAFKLT